MLFDLKYHVASLVAVFLALGLGILIGSALDDNGNNVQQQEKIVQSLKGDFDELRLKNQSLESDNKKITQAEARSQQFGKRVMPALASSKLAKGKIMLVVCGDAADGEQVRNTISLAGGNVVKEIKFNSKYPDAVIAALGLKNTTKGDISVSDKEKYLSESSAKIIGDYAKGTESELLNKLIIQKALNVKTDNADVVPNVVIVVGGYATADLAMMDYVDVPVIRALIASQYRVIGVEKSDIGYSSVSEYKKMGIPTVDDIDTSYGTLSLVYVAAGWDGHYGEKPEAEKLMPEKISPGGLVN